MTQYEWENIKDWFGKHSNRYWWPLLTFGIFAVLGQLIMYDALYDGGSYYDPYPTPLDVDHGDKWEGKVIGDKYPVGEWWIFGAVLTAPFAFWIWTLPVNTFLLKIRRRDFFNGEKRPSKRELRVKERERQAQEAIAEIRRFEAENNMPHYEFGPLSDTRI